MSREDNIIQDMEPFEKNQMLRCWQAAISCAENYNKERSFIYWDEVQYVLKELCRDGFIKEENLDYIIQELEQKMYYVRAKEESDEKYNS